MIDYYLHVTDNGLAINKGVNVHSCGNHGQDLDQLICSCSVSCNKAEWRFLRVKNWR